MPIPRSGKRPQPGPDAKPVIDVGLALNGAALSLLKPNSGGGAMTLVGAPKEGVSAQGRALVTAGSADGLAFPATLPNSPTGATLVWFGRLASVASAQVLVGLGDSGSTDTLFFLQADSGTGKYLFALRDNGQLASATLTGSTAIAANADVLVAGVYRSSTGEKSLWVNGGKEATSTASFNPFVFANTTVNFLRRTSDSSWLNGSTYLAAVIPRALSDAECVALYRDPWGFIYGRRRPRLWVGAAAGAGTINATPGTWSWSGTTQVIPALVAAAPGAWTWAGSVQVLSALVSATPGTWSWAGTSQGLSKLIATTPGSYSWAGTSQQVLAGGVINTAPGTWNWVGTTQQIAQLVTVYAAAGAWSWLGTLQGITTPGSTVTPSPAHPPTPSGGTSTASAQPSLSGVTTSSGQLTRQQIGEMVGGNQRLVRWVETMLQDVKTTLPQAIDGINTGADDAQGTADSALALASQALAAVNAMQDIGDALAGLQAALASVQDAQQQLAARIDSLELRPSP